MAEDSKDNSTYKEINSPVELEQPCVFANPIPDNLLLGDVGRCNNSDAAAVLSSVDDSVEGIVGIQCTGNRQLSLKDDQVPSSFVLSNLDSGSSERDASLESNKGVSSPLTTVKENVMTDNPHSVDEVTNKELSSPLTIVTENVMTDNPHSVDEVTNKELSSPLTTVTENVMTDNPNSVDEVATGISASGECPNGEELVEAPGSDIKLGDKHVSLDNQKPEESSNNVADSVNSKDVADSVNSKYVADSVNSKDVADSVNSKDVADSVNSKDVADSVNSKDVADSVNSKDVADRSENGCSEMVAEKQLKEAENRQVAPSYNEHVEELDYEENDADDGCGRSEKEGQKNQDGQSDKDEGELTDDDCEEGEIKEPGSRKAFVKPMCRFFQRGSCSWGPSCRFLHPGVNDMGNYQLIELPGCAPTGIRTRIGVPGMWPELEEEAPLPPPLIPEIPLVETAWERGLRLAKERKKAVERKEKEPDFEEKRLNLSVDNDWEVNKENEHLPIITSNNPYYAQPECEVDEYYKVPSEPWPPGHYENNQVRYNQDRAFSPPYRVKPPVATSARYDLLYGPPEKFDRERLGLPEPVRLEAASVAHSYAPSKRPDEWTDPWSRSKPSKTTKSKSRGASRGRRKHRSASDDSHSSRSRSKSSGSSGSSRSYSSSSGSSSRSKSTEAAPSGLDRRDRYLSPPRDQLRSGMPARGSGPYPGYYQNNRGTNSYQRAGYHASNGSGGYHGNNYGGGSARAAGGYAERDARDRSRDRTWKPRGRSPPDRPLPYVRPRPKSASSNSESSRSRSRSRNRISSSRSRSSSGSSRSSSSSSSSAGSADSDHLYRDLGNPLKKPQTPTSGKKSKINSRTTNGTHLSTPPAAMPAFRLDQIPHPQDPKPPQPAAVKAEPRYASRNVPLPPVKPKDPLKVVGQKSNIKLTLLPKSSLGSRPNPLDSPPRKRQLDRDMSSPESPPPAKQPNLANEASVLRLASEKAAKLTPRAVVKPLSISLPQSAPPSASSSASSLASGSPVKAITVPQSAPPSSSSSATSLASGSPVKAITVPQKQQAASVKPRTMEPAMVKTAPRAPVTNTPVTTAVGKAKKTVVSRREELLKQLKAVEDAIAKKKGKLA